MSRTVGLPDAKLGRGGPTTGHYTRHVLLLEHIHLRYTLFMESVSPPAFSVCKVSNNVPYAFLQ